MAETVDTAKKEVERLDAIINQFLKALRPVKLYFKTTNLKDVLTESLNFMRHEIENRSVEVKFLWGNNIPPVQADEGQLKQAFYNIIKNAIQSMPHGGSLNISCEQNGEGETVIEFSDTGKGIAPEDMSRIFNAYFTTKASGNGLGLMIVERIIRQHGARLSIESVKGKGTRFTVVFPVMESRVRVLGPANDCAGILPPASEEGL